MKGIGRDAQRQGFRVVLKDGRVIYEHVSHAFARAFVRIWNRQIDRREPAAYIQPVSPTFHADRTKR